ncbi:hypothetical protein V8D89_002927 [Ganoderma adspersum]
MQGLSLQAFMQGLQPAQVVFAGNPFGMMAPQYPAIAPILPQAPQQAQFPAPADQPWFQALVTAVSTAVMKDIEKLNAPPAAAPADKLSPDNEKILIDALKKGKEDKLPMERIFQDLCKKHGYTENVWMKWFATNVDKLYPRLAPPKAGSERAAVGDAARGSSGSSNQALAPGPRSASSNPPTATLRFIQEQPQARSRKVVIQTPKPPAGSAQAKSTPAVSARAALPSSNGSSVNPSSKAPSNLSSSRPPASQSVSTTARTPYSVNRSKRGGSVPIVWHDQTIIPWSDGSTKPSVPRSDTGPAKPQLPRRTSASVPQVANNNTAGGGGEPGTKLTDDEKIFFVHWLRWRLREGRLPDKETLFEELEAELPQRTAETWKKHWSGNCEVPDALYIAARKRVDSARDDARGESPLTPLAARDTSDGSSESSESEPEPEPEPDASDNEQSTYHPASASASARKPAVRPGPGATNTATNFTAMKTKAGKTVRRAHLGGVRITDEDLRAMARYKFARRSDWENRDISYKAFWYDFAHRPENSKRSWDGWNSVARNDRHLPVINRYVRELERHAAAAAQPSTILPSSTLNLSSKPASPLGTANPSAPQQNRPALPTSMSTPSSGAGASKQLGDAKTGAPGPLKRAAEVDNANAGGKELPPLKRVKNGWDVDPAEILDLTGDSD